LDEWDVDLVLGSLQSLEASDNLPIEVVRTRLGETHREETNYYGDNRKGLTEIVLDLSNKLGWAVQTWGTGIGCPEFQQTLGCFLFFFFNIYI
jgi:hypothetical protein